jgi:S1-C subfamily serine protease
MGTTNDRLNRLETLAAKLERQFKAIPTDNLQQSQITRSGTSNSIQSAMANCSKPISASGLSGKVAWIALVFALSSLILATRLTWFQTKPLPTKPILSELIDQVRPSVVKIRTEFGSGTGFLVGSKGYVITANHMVNAPGKPQARRISVDWPAPPIASNTKRVSGIEAANFGGTSADVLDVDPLHDLALLTPRENPYLAAAQPLLRNEPNFPPAGHASAARLSVVGQPLRDGIAVFLCGYPLDFPILITTAGSVASSTSMTGELTPDGSFALTDQYWVDIKSNHGNSGGPLFSMTGEVVGVLTGVHPTNLDFAPGRPSGIPLAARGHLDPKQHQWLTDNEIEPAYQNSGIAYAVPVSYVINLLKKHRIPFNDE